MPDISLDLRAKDYATDQNVPVRAWRAFVPVRFINRSGLLVRYQAFVDPGAPFSVIPYSLWDGRQIQWAPLGQQLIHGGKPVRAALMWQGIPCDLGSTEIYLLDLRRGIRTGPHTVVAKFARRTLQPAIENTAIMGMSFLADNDLHLFLEGNRGAMTGSLSSSGP